MRLQGVSHQKRSSFLRRYTHIGSVKLKIIPKAISITKSIASMSNANLFSLLKIGSKERFHVTWQIQKNCPNTLVSAVASVIFLATVPLLCQILQLHLSKKSARRKSTSILSLLLLLLEPSENLLQLYKSNFAVSSEYNLHAAIKTEICRKYCHAVLNQEQTSSQSLDQFWWWPTAFYPKEWWRRE